VEAASILARYLQDDPARLADLLADANEAQFGILFPGLRAHGDQALTLLRKELEETPRRDPRQPILPEQERRARRQASAATALLLGQPEAAWPVFRHRPDPTARTYLLHRAAPRGVPALLLVGRLFAEQDVSAVRALILALGVFPPEAVP
jgi:hypothetical protein